MKVEMALCEVKIRVKIIKRLTSSKMQQQNIKRRLGTLKRHLTSAVVSNEEHERLAWEEKSISYSTGMFRPVLFEADRLHCQVVFGVLPKDLVGTYYRNGPNAKHPAGPEDPYHLFDGDGMIAAFYIDAQQGVVFSHKWVQTERLIFDHKAGTSIYDFGSLASGKAVGHLPGVVNEDGVRMGKANTSLLSHHGKLLALEDADLPYHIHPGTLATLPHPGQRQVFDGDEVDDPRLPVFTAHPRVCPHTGELIGYGCMYSPSQEWTYARLSPEGKVLNTFNIPLNRSSYAHDFGCTREFAMVFDGSLSMDWKVVMASAMGKKIPAESSGHVWNFDRDTPGRIGVFPREATLSSQVRWFNVAPFCVSHTCCCFQEPTDPDVIVIVSNNIGNESFSPLFPAVTPLDPDANLHMYRLRWSTGTVEEEKVLWRGRSDFPTTNRQWRGATRYVYAAMLDYTEPEHCPQLVGFYKFDLVSNTMVRETWPSTCFGGEPLFVPRGQHGEEDDGFVLVLVNDMKSRRTELRVYDAQKLGTKNGHVATVQCPRRIVPLGTHGLWMNGV